METEKTSTSKTPSTNFIIILFVFAFLLVFFSWFFTQNLRHIPEYSDINLEGNCDKLVTAWYQSELQNHTDKIRINDDLDIASEFIERNYNITINKNKLVIGDDIANAVKTLTGKHISDTKIKIYDIRSMVGIPGEIAYVPSKSLRRKLQKHLDNSEKSVDINFLDKIMSKNLDTTARKFLFDKLNERWNRLLSLQDPRIMNNKGSYLYMFNTDISKVTGSIEHNSSKGVITRYNLLCSDLEFKYFIERLTKDSKTSSLAIH